MKLMLTAILAATVSIAFAQPDRWQQKVKYSMDIQMNVQTNQFTGKQKLEYWNNSPDTLTKLFYHLYFNAFQPNSMMDVRSRRQGTMQGGRGPDWDGRVKDRIVNLKPDEIGYQRIRSLKMNGIAQPFTMQETILEVNLTKPILPKTRVVLDMDFEAQVPIQIRRSGRDNPTTKVRYSMSQWYPKLCEYDYEGWHPTPYIAREFYGVWGDFDVNITIDKKYILGGTGYLQNANQIGYGYETPGVKVVQPAGDKLTWRFTAPNVHDFVWAADPDFKHVARQVKKDLTLHLLYKPTNASEAEWLKVLDDAQKVLPFIEKNFGAYPYKQYSFIHGGDGGMEYPMATLLIGPGAWLHEWMHSWYQMILGTNESLYSWMDEGFTTFAEEKCSAFLEGTLDNTRNVHADSYAGYFALVKSGKEEPMTTHADHYNTNFAYSIASYSKGSVFLEQLGYITGAAVRDRILLNYYNAWRFKHPNAADFMRIAEKTSGMKLDWYKEYFVNGTKTIDYKVDSLWEEGGKTNIRLKRVGLTPMPVDCMVTLRDGSTQMHYVPMYLMFGNKQNEYPGAQFVKYDAWKWTHDTYVIQVNQPLQQIQTVDIDPDGRMADVDRKNNKLEVPKFK